MMVRGNGLGLAWDTATPMLHTCGSDSWHLTVNYRVDLSGFVCDGCADEARSLLLDGEPLIFRFSVKLDNGTEINMKGPSHMIKLPVSMTSASFDDKPTFPYWPYFFSTSGENSLPTGQLD